MGDVNFLSITTVRGVLYSFGAAIRAFAFPSAARVRATVIFYGSFTYIQVSSLGI